MNSKAIRSGLQLLWAKMPKCWTNGGLPVLPVCVVHGFHSIVATSGYHGLRPERPDWPRANPAASECSKSSNSSFESSSPWTWQGAGFISWVEQSPRTFIIKTIRDYPSSNSASCQRVLASRQELPRGLSASWPSGLIGRIFGWLPSLQVTSFLPRLHKNVCSHTYKLVPLPAALWHTKSGNLQNKTLIWYQNNSCESGWWHAKNGVWTCVRLSDSETWANKYHINE